MEIIAIAACLFLVATLYSSVGHGGASGYIAVLALFSYPLFMIKQDALILNILVSAIAFVQYARAGFFKWKLFLPLALGSIPLAHLGGSLKPDIAVFKIILGMLLIIPAILFLVNKKSDENNLRKMPLVLSVCIGAGLGFVSGLTGIGGGVFLSPMLILGRWAGQKQAAATSALFIFVNSIAGLIGSKMGNTPMDASLPIFAAACVFGGFAGSLLGAWKLNPNQLKRFLAAVLVIASVKLLLG